MSISAMKQALEALDAYSWEQVDAARSALRQAIAEAEKQQQIAEDFIKYGASWSKDGKRIDPSEIYAPTQAPVHAIDISQERVDETAKREHDCNKCENRGRVLGDSQESYCENCIYGSPWKKDYYKEKNA